MKLFIKTWLVIVAVAVLVAIFGTIYIVAQQSLRLGANNPQIQLAEDAAAMLDAGKLPTASAATKIDIAKSLAPFVIIYDQQGRVIEANGYLNGDVPVIPFGVLQAAQGRDYHFVTWQPTSRLRIAAVSVAAQKYYVLSGRSLKEVERLEQQVLELCLIGLVISSGVVIFGSVVLGKAYTLMKDGNKPGRR